MLSQTFNNWSANSQIGDKMPEKKKKLEANGKRKETLSVI